MVVGRTSSMRAGSAASSAYFGSAHSVAATTATHAKSINSLLIATVTHQIKATTRVRTQRNPKPPRFALEPRKKKSFVVSHHDS